MKYDPKNASNTIPEGTYQATIHSVTDTDKDGHPMQTQKGYDMERVTFEVWSKSGNSRKHGEYFSAGPNALWRYKKLAEAIGPEAAQRFKEGTFSVGDYLGANVVLDIVVEDDEKYGEQNRVAKINRCESAPTTAPAQAGKNAAKLANVKPIDVGNHKTSTINDEDIPF